MKSHQMVNCLTDLKKGDILVNRKNPESNTFRVVKIHGSLLNPPGWVTVRDAAGNEISLWPDDLSQI